MDYPVVATHNTCGEPVFVYSHMPETGEVMHSSDALLPNGDKPFPGDKIICPKCGDLYDGISVSLLDEE